MKKTERHLLIQQMIRNENCPLKKERFRIVRSKKRNCCNANDLCHDLRDLGLVKVKRKDQLYYILPNEPEVAERFILCCPAMPSLSHGQNSPWSCGQS